MLRWISFTVVGLVVLGCQSGAGSGARARPTIRNNRQWKDLKCPYESDRTVGQRLNSIIQRAKNDGMNGDPDIKVLTDKVQVFADKCLNHSQFKDPPPNDRHVWRVYGGWMYAERAYGSNTKADKIKFYGLCISEMEHMDGGSFD